MLKVFVDKQVWQNLFAPDLSMLGHKYKKITSKCNIWQNSSSTDSNPSHFMVEAYNSLPMTKL